MLGIFLDLEANGLNPFKHRTLEIAFKIIDLYTGEVQASYESVIYHPQTVWANSDQDSLEINGFTWHKISLGKQEKDVAQEIINILEKAEVRRGRALFICQNPSFDRAFFSQIVDVDTQEKLLWPYHWLDLASMYWALHIKEMHSHQGTSLKDGLSKDDIAKSYNISPEAQPHRAMNGVNHLIDCYKMVVGLPFAAAK